MLILIMMIRKYQHRRPLWVTEIPSPHIPASISKGFIRLQFLFN